MSQILAIAELRLRTTIRRVRGPTRLVNALATLLMLVALGALSRDEEWLEELAYDPVRELVLELGAASGEHAHP